jgi:hypothetical protein
MANQKTILCPTRCFCDWRQFLADPEKQWKQGYSAYELAHSWESANGVPEEVMSALREAKCAEFSKARLLFAIPEYKVHLPGGNRASQADVFSLLTSPTGLIILLVEGKARENFDVELGTWKLKTSRKGQMERLNGISKELGLVRASIPDSIRYQLLHRAASAMILAREYHSTQAIMLVQSFEKDDKKNHLCDYVAFGNLFGKSLSKGEIVEVSTINGIQLFLGWVESQATIEV